MANQDKAIVVMKKAIMDPKQLDAFEMALPSMISKERFVRVALTTLNRTPLLATCTPASVVTCLLECASLGLEADGRRAHLIPFKNNKKACYECQLIIDYKGLIELGRRSGELKDWRAELVCDKDVFEYKNGQAEHVINFREKRGEPYAVYSCAIFKDDTKSFCVMTADEIESVRRRSKAGNAGPWITDAPEMWKKTVIRRHSKTLPLSAEFRDALDKDFDSLSDITNEIEVGPPQAPRRRSDRKPEPEVLPQPEPEVLPPAGSPDDFQTLYDNPKITGKVWKRILDTCNIDTARDVSDYTDEEKVSLVHLMKATIGNTD